MSFRVRVKALKSGSSASIEIDDVIEGWGSSSAKTIRNSLKSTKGATSLNVYINSAGGEVTEGLAVYNMLLGHSARKVVEIGGIAASMASIIAMAGDDIIMPKNSWMMIHNPWAGVCGESDDMRKTADLLDKFRDQLAGIYSARTGQKIEDVLAAMAAETWMSGDEAKALGYCSTVTEPTKIAARFDARRFVNAPKALQRAKPKGQQKMDPELLTALGLPEDATLEDVLAAIKVLQQAANPEPDGDEQPPSDGDDGEAGPEQKLAAKRRAQREAAAALSAAGNNAILAELKKLNKGFSALSTRVDGNERSDLIKANAKKFTPALEKAAAKWDLETLKSFIKAAPDAVEDDEEPEEDGTAVRGAAALSKGKKVELSKTELEMCKATGRKPAVLLAFKQKQAEKESA